MTSSVMYSSNRRQVFAFPTLGSGCGHVTSSSTNGNLLHTETAFLANVLSSDIALSGKRDSVVEDPCED